MKCLTFEAGTQGRSQVGQSSAPVGSPLPLLLKAHAQLHQPSCHHTPLIIIGRYKDTWQVQVKPRCVIRVSSSDNRTTWPPRDAEQQIMSDSFDVLALTTRYHTPWSSQYETLHYTTAPMYDRSKTARTKNLPLYACPCQRRIK